ncbi:hypothetical protein [Zunongwangia sp.]|uniref:hypothetical protein n=1 Tax=Zunongwangia sp. TaxID=1965325 RepID=UPI003AA8A6CE
MIQRYPHTAVIEIETLSDDPLPTKTTQDIEVKGRYESAPGNKNIDYKAKFFCDKTPDILKADPNALDGKKLLIFGRSITIRQAWPYQTHCELWLD